VPSTVSRLAYLTINVNEFSLNFYDFFVNIFWFLYMFEIFLLGIGWVLSSVKIF